MAAPFIGEIKIVPYTFAPRNWAFCEGQLLSISQHDALFSLLGTTYGGDGRTTFGLPDLRGRVPISAGQGPGLRGYLIGSRGGIEAEVLSTMEIPSHGHGMTASPDLGSQADPTGAYPARSPLALGYVYKSSPGSTMPGDTLSQTGGNGAHENRQPYQVINYVIALVGIYPPRI